MDPKETSSRLIVLIMVALASMVLFFINVSMLNSFMMYGVVSPLDYNPDNLEVISRSIPFYISLYFKYRYFWDFYGIDILVYMLIFLWVLGFSPRSIFFGGAILCFLFFVFEKNNSGSPTAAFSEVFMSKKPYYLYNDNTVMIYGQSDVASLYFLQKNINFLSKTDISKGLLNSRKTLSMDEVLEFYLSNEEPGVKTHEK